jgi:hypothetical protein
VHRIATNIEDAGWIIRDMLVWAYASGFPKSKASLKPAWEPIVMARKPGPLRMLAIDECRIPHNGAEDLAESQGKNPGRDGETVTSGVYGADRPQLVNVAGRWPANVLLTSPIFDGGVEGVVGGGMQDSPAPYVRSVAADGGVTAWNTEQVGSDVPGYGDSGTYSRFFLIPKADRSDREPVLGGEVSQAVSPRIESAHSTVCAKCGRQRVNVPGAACACPDPEWVRKAQTARANFHPTVKPTDLMRHLVRLVTPTRVPVWVCERCGVEVEYAHGEAGSITTPMRTVRGSDSHGSRQPDAVLLQGVQHDPHGQTSLELPGMGEEPEGLHPRASSETSDGEPRGLLDAASADRGGDAGPDAPTDRGGRPHQRGQVGQPPREPSRHGQASARQSPEAAEEADQLPALRRPDHPLGADPACDGRLVPGERPGRVLDPFLGSGTTGIACELEGFRWIGIEKEAEYVAIAEARLNGTQRGLGLSA